MPPIPPMLYNNTGDYRRHQLLCARDVTVRRLTVDGKVIAEYKRYKIANRLTFLLYHSRALYLWQRISLCDVATISLYVYTRARLTGYGTVIVQL